MTDNNTLVLKTTMTVAAVFQMMYAFLSSLLIYIHTGRSIRNYPAAIISVSITVKDSQLLRDSVF